MSLLVLSLALPPIPAKVIERAQSRAFIDLKDLLPDNIAPVQWLHETAGPSHVLAQSRTGLHDIQDPLTWISCFITYMAAQVEHACRKTRDLLAYGQIVVNMARKHGVQGWLAYNSMFRQQLAAVAALTWTEIDSSLMAATILGPRAETPGQVCLWCLWCLASAHSRHEHALWWLDTHLTPQRSPCHTEPTSVIPPFSSP